jgi:hypothetical protein
MFRYIYGVFIFFNLQLTKLLLKRRVQVGFSWDRLMIEAELCRLSSFSMGKVLVVGIHERSFVYQLIIPAIYVDYDRTFLCLWMPDVLLGDALTAHKCAFDYVFLSGVFGYGSDASHFSRMLYEWLNEKKSIVVFDWNSNIQFHIDLACQLGCSLEVKNYQRQIRITYFEGCKVERA